MQRKSLTLFFSLCFISLFAQNEVFENQIFDTQIHSVQFFRPDWELTYPVIHLNSTEKLELNFDDLSGETRDFNYEIIYCNTDWTESDLMKTDYLQGFDNIPLEDFAFSSNTTQNYIHYKLSIPNEDIRPLLSGNYIINIFKTDEPDSLILTQRFYVVEDRINTKIQIIRPLLSQYNNSHQQINLKLTDINNLIRNPYNDLRLLVKQNNRPDKKLFLKKPDYVEGNTYIYNNEQKNILPGGNEFHHFDTKNIYFREMRTDSIRYIKNTYHFYIQEDDLKPWRSYETRPDIDGQYFIKLEGKQESQIFADYIHVHLSVNNNKYLMGGKLYVVGDFNSWQTNPSSELKYNSENSDFQVDLFLKQGYYNYSYRLINQQNNYDIIDNHTETENNYLIFIYLKNKTLRNDQLIGFSIYNTKTGLYSFK